jgi:hypothetical protein
MDAGAIDEYGWIVLAACLRLSAETGTDRKTCQLDDGWETFDLQQVAVIDAALLACCLNDVLPCERAALRKSDRHTLFSDGSDGNCKETTSAPDSASA